MPPVPWGLLPTVVLGAVVVYAVWAWARRRREGRYDLRGLRDARYEPPLAGDEEPDEDGVTGESGPYCHSCDAAYPAGTPRCFSCGRPL